MLSNPFPRKGTETRLAAAHRGAGAPGRFFQTHFPARGLKLRGTVKVHLDTMTFKPISPQGD